ncbi:MAG: SDR family oxidoreductase [Polyangiaceae bacterium]
MSDASTQMRARVFLVTGGTQGVGEAIALALAQAGAAGVAVSGRNEARGRAVVSALEALGARGLFVPGDLADPDSCSEIVAACDAAFGRIDGLVNAAAESTRGTLDSTTLELWDRLFAVNVRAPFLLSQAVVRVMRREGNGGTIVNVLSMSAHGGQSFLTAYAASKGALATLTRNLAHALRNERVRVNGIYLGWTATPAEDVVQQANGAPIDWLAIADGRQPFGRLIRPRDVANLAVFLASDAAEMMTGALVDLDQNVAGAYFDP